MTASTRPGPPAHDVPASPPAGAADAAVPAPPPGTVVHRYDDIEEHDNRLPRWWLYTLYGAIAFSVAYWFGEQKVRAFRTPGEAYQVAMREERLAQARSGGGKAPTPEALSGLARDAEIVGKGKALFASTCSACHGPEGGGGIGPNLTDEYWLHGGRPENVYACIHDGVPAKGMPSWGPQLGGEKVTTLTAFVLSIRNSHAPNGKPPQGERETFAAAP
jgi:cytochrome c oxidase cbb3-type subunit III